MATLLDRRRAGVLLHPSSLPGAGYSGDFGDSARRFVDFMAAAGLQVWQVLPLGPTHSDRCPYQSVSAHAGNPDLISLDRLATVGWLNTDQVAAGQSSPDAKRDALDNAAASFFDQLRREPDSPLACAYRDFLANAAFWLEDYVRFQAFRDDLNKAPWASWPQGLRDHDERACTQRARELAPQLDLLRFRQFVFHHQWHELRCYANERGILLFGDMPIYVHLESADVWAHQSLFDLDESGRPNTVTGVPPDYFSDQGQLWGNPQYDWRRMAQDGFQWWLQRFASAAQQFDMVRIDHFRALEAFWEIAAGADTARAGRWVQAPGRTLLELVREHCPELCLVAENLGTISPEVEQLRSDFDLPGMLILQFAFDGNQENPYLTHMHGANEVVYTGTHDNDTTVGWFDSLDADTRARVLAYFGNPDEPMPWMLIRQAMCSPANTAIVPWQDFLGLDGTHRMNTPGTLEGNWLWRFDWPDVPVGLAHRIREVLAACDRLPPASTGPVDPPGEFPPEMKSA